MTTVNRAFRILFVCLVCVGLGQSMLFAILPPAARDIGLSPFQVSTIFATSATIWVFVSPMWGRQSDVWGRRLVILIGLLGFALSMTLLATMIEIGLRDLLPALAVYPLMVAARSVFALLGSGTGPASQAYIAERTSASERTAGLALVSAAIGVGESIGPALGALLSLVGLLAPLYFSAALAVVSAVAIWRFLPEDGPPIRPGERRPARMSFRDRRVVPFFAIGACTQAVRATTTITLAFFLQDTLGLDAHQTVRHAGIGFSVFAVATIFAQLVLVQRLRPSPRRLMRVGLFLGLIAFVLFSARPGFAGCLVALALLGAGLGMTRPGYSAGASLAVEPEEQGAVAGLTGSIGVLGNIFGPLLGTSLYQWSPIGPYALNAAIMALAWGFAFANPRLRRAG
jgi:MFS family permease